MLRNRLNKSHIIYGRILLMSFLNSLATQAHLHRTAQRIYMREARDKKNTIGNKQKRYQNNQNSKQQQQINNKTCIKCTFTANATAISHITIYANDVQL